MSFDGMFTHVMVHELNNVLLGGRISKIHQPSKQEILFQIRTSGCNNKLLLSAHPSYARLHITNETYDNPKEAPLFCMILRKHLEGGIIESISQHGVDRIVIFKIKSRNEIGDISYKQLIIEIMGRHSNITLIDDKSTIIDCIKHLSSSVNRYRTMLPGCTYIAPPEQEKKNPFDEAKEHYTAEQLVSEFAGISPLFAREASKGHFLSMIQDIRTHHITPQLIQKDGKEIFYMLPLTHMQGVARTFPTLGELLDRFYFSKADRDRVKQQSYDLERLMANEKQKNEKKIIKLQTSLKEAENAEQFKLYGELLTTYLYTLKRGDKLATLTNYYDDTTATIILNPQKTPSENAQSYFLKYQKLKSSVAFINEQIEKAYIEIKYFDHLLQQMESASAKDIEGIREELMEEGYIRHRPSKKKQTKMTIERYLSTDQTEILVGKNNKQNDFLTNKLAARDELWLHTKDIPGSHVIIRSKTPSEQTIQEAAHLAAYFSKARQSSSVPVDYTLIRHVKKVSGAKPGFVTYEQQQTIYVTPSEDLVRLLRSGELIK